MRHISHIDRIAEAIADYRLCLFYIKAPDCGVCNVMLDKVGRMAEHHPLLDAFYTDIIEEPLIAPIYEDLFSYWTRTRCGSLVYATPCSQTQDPDESIMTAKQSVSMMHELYTIHVCMMHMLCNK